MLKLLTKPVGVTSPPIYGEIEYILWVDFGKLIITNVRNGTHY